MMATHPSTPERVAHAVAVARGFGAPGIGETGHDRYLAAIDGILYGDDPAEGFVRGRRFIHPKLGFAFTAPENFVLENSAQAVLGVTQDGAQALRLDRVKVPVETSLASYLASGLDRRAAIGNGRAPYGERPPGRDRDRQGGVLVVPPRRHPGRAGSLPAHFRGQGPDARRRPALPRRHRHVPSHHDRRCTRT